MGGGLIVNINSPYLPTTVKPMKLYTRFHQVCTEGFLKDTSDGKPIGTGVEIIDVHPGGIQTNMTRDRKGFESMMSPEDVTLGSSILSIVTVVTSMKLY